MLSHPIRRSNDHSPFSFAEVVLNVVNFSLAPGNLKLRHYSKLHFREYINLFDFAPSQSVRSLAIDTCSRVTSLDKLVQHNQQREARARTPCKNCVSRIGALTCADAKHTAGAGGPSAGFPCLPQNLTNKHAFLRVRNKTKRPGRSHIEKENPRELQLGE